MSRIAFLKKSLDILKIRYVEYKEHAITKLFIPDFFTVAEPAIEIDGLPADDYTNKCINFLIVDSEYNFLFVDNQNKEVLKNSDIIVYYCLDCGRISIASKTAKIKCRKNNNFCNSSEIMSLDKLKILTLRHAF